MQMHRHNADRKTAFERAASASREPALARQLRDNVHALPKQKGIQGTMVLHQDVCFAGCSHGLHRFSGISVRPRAEVSKLVPVRPSHSDALGFSMTERVGVPPSVVGHPGGCLSKIVQVFLCQWS